MSLVALANADGTLGEAQRVGEWNGLRLWADFNNDDFVDAVYGRPRAELETSLGAGVLQLSPPVKTAVDVSELANAIAVDVDGDTNLDIVGIFSHRGT